MARSERIFAAVDIGTTKVVAVAGKINEEGKTEIVGLGQAMSKGIKRGVVLNIDEAFSAIDEALGKAEEGFDGYIEHVYVNLAGQQLKNQSVAMQKFLPGKVVSENDVKSIYDQAMNHPVPEGYKIFYANPVSYTIDGEPVLSNPVGAAGSMLESTYRLYVAPEQYEQNLQKCFDRGGVKVKQCVIDPLAASEVVLTDDEKEAGVILLDIGGGTTKMSIYHENVLCFSSVIPFGGNVITNDIKEGCSILLRQAESLKTQFGQAMGDFAPQEKVVTIPGISGWEPKEISFKNLAFIIQYRMDEIIDAVWHQVLNSGFCERVGAGIVLTGGTALLPNLTQLIKFRTGLDVRIGKPSLKTISGGRGLDDPRYATVLGLLSLAVNDGVSTKIRKKKKKTDEEGIFSKLTKQVAKQVTLFFEEEQDTEMY